MSGVRTSVSALLVTAAFLCAPGCVTRTPASPERALMTPPPRLHAAVRPARRLEELEVLLTAPYRVDAASRERMERLDLERGILFAQPRAPRRRETAMRYVSHSPRAPRLDGPSRRSLVQDTRLSRTRLILYEPLADPVRGLVVHVSSITPGGLFEMTAARGLRLRGWAVLRVDRPELWAPEPSGAGPSSHEVIDDRLMSRWLARGVAAFADEFVAEWADAVDAGLAYVRDERPDIPMHPLVTTAYSLGAIAAPGIIALSEHPPDAVVLVAGGAPAPRILWQHFGNDLLAESDAMPYRSRNGRIGAVYREEYDDAYLASSYLDPWHTAASLAGVPVLQVHASWDRIVPAASGDGLYERLGRPERWSFSVGHLGLFWILPIIRGDIADWIEAQVRALDVKRATSDASAAVRSRPRCNS